MSTTTSRPTGIRLTRALLACGPLYAVLWVVANDVVAAGMYPGYDPLSQAVSELSATGSPAKAVLTALFPLWPFLTAAFGVGVLRAADGQRALRVTGCLLIAHGIVALLWLAFPMTSRTEITPGAPAAANDVGHIVLTVVTVAFILAQIGFSAAAFGWRTRLVAIVGVVVVVAFGTLTGVVAASLPLGGPTPWMGLFERISIAPWLLWMVVLAVALARPRAVGPRGSRPDDPAH
jgi:hypothetical protein